LGIGKSRPTNFADKSKTLTLRWLRDLRNADPSGHQGVVGADSDAVRRKIEAKGAAPNIPPKSNRVWKNYFLP